MSDGGFGITYKAIDTQLNRMVAIKEFLPADTAVRVPGSSQVNAYESRATEYNYGLEQFLTEAKTLARFHHPNIIGVLDHLELNNTAYLIMTYEQGQTLSQLLKQQGKLPEQELKAIVKAILIGLQHIHEQDYYHRDIKPGNIYLRKQGEPVLIDFGAARQAIGARSRSLTNIVSAGYAPSEQYGSNQSKQGAWTDLYAVGATMYKSISGKEPTDAPTRSSDIMEGDPDPLIPAQTIAKGHYTEELLQLIDWMLAPAIKNRPQNVSQVLAKLEQKQNTEEPRSTEVTQLQQQEARSTLVTEIIRPNLKPSPEKQQQTNRYTENQPIPTTKSKTKWIVSSLILLILVTIGITQKDQLQSYLNNSTPQEKEQKVQITTQQSQEQQIQAGVQQELNKREQQQKAQQQAKTADQQRQKQHSIQTLLKQAATDIQQMRLSSPQGNNAVEKYQQVIQLQANNKTAQQGLTQITEKYLLMAESAQQQQNYKKARQHLNKAKKIQPENK